MKFHNVAFELYNTSHTVKSFQMLGLVTMREGCRNLHSLNSTNLIKICVIKTRDTRPATRTFAAYC
jgi:hypothetical protein